MNEGGGRGCQKGLSLWHYGHRPEALFFSPSQNHWTSLQVDGASGSPKDTEPWVRVLLTSDSDPLSMVACSAGFFWGPPCHMSPPGSSLAAEGNTPPPKSNRPCQPQSPDMILCQTPERDPPNLLLSSPSPLLQPPDCSLAPVPGFPSPCS